MGGFYKYIVKSEYNTYQIMKDNEKYGTFNKLTDALYERDRLIKCDWDYDKLSECPETENIYETIKLPRFIHEYSYITHYPGYYKVYWKKQYMAGFNTYEQAEKYARHIGGRIVTVHGKYRIQKSIDGKPVYFSTHDTLEEAKKERDRLIENNWREE